MQVLQCGWEPTFSEHSHDRDRGERATAPPIPFTAGFHRSHNRAGLVEMSEQKFSAVETEWIRAKALDLGLAACGVAAAEKFPELENYSEWVERGYAGEMKYLEDRRRFDPREPMFGVRSLIVCALNYNTALPYSTEAAGETVAGSEGVPRGWISRYAWGDDYHEVMWSKLNLLSAELRQRFGDSFELRAYADTGPIHERAAAKHAGLGWLAKNTLLINQDLGSWLFLGVILTSLPLAPTLEVAEAPPADRCGTCTRCIDACPTQAIVEPYVLDARKCISYLTIELRGPIPEELREPIGQHVYGCDICQDVCPWNRKAPRSELQAFQPREFADHASESGHRWSLYLPDLLALAQLDGSEFREKFRGSAIKRTKWSGLVRNACTALGNAKGLASSTKREGIVNILVKLASHQDTGISGSARWALSRIQSL
jgi:epoxyqueuosine reductase